MMTPSDRLQYALERLAAGEALDRVASGLPADEAADLKLAAALQDLEVIAPAADRLAAQRQAVLRAARAAPTPPAPTRRPLWPWLLAASGAVGVLALCTLTAVSAGALWWWTARSAPVAQSPSTPPAMAGMAAEATAAAVAPDPQSAALSEAHGLVEVQAADGAWQPAASGALVSAGARVRTGALSRVTLTFYDGSQAQLGPNTEVSVDALDAQRAGPRVIRLTQVRGDSDHTVAKSALPDSVYEVATPSGAGRAQGTAFHVSVTVVNVSFAVSEGAVAVTNLDVTVVVVAGQTSVIVVGHPPAEPALQITGEGAVQQIGETWFIAGQALRVTADTVITGEPQVDDWVTFTGRQLADGTRVADRITLVRRSLTNAFSFIGTVDALGPDAWIIAGRTVRVDGLTQIEAGLAVGDTVEVTGGLAADGTFWAATLRRWAAADLSVPFTWTGVVQAISATVWTVSDLTLTVDVSTTLPASVVLGDLVRVDGVVEPGGVWRARTIQKLTAPDQIFDITGVLISRDPWNVGGVAFTVDDDTDVDDDLRLGDRVRVRGRVLADGTRLAERVERIDAGRRHAVQFTARVAAIDPWVIGGVTVTVDAKTKLAGDIAVGDLVRVKGSLRPDGTVVADKITLVDDEAGCISLSAVVSAINARTLTLLDGRTLTLDDSVAVTGTLQIASVVIVNGCVDEAGQIIVIAITVVFQLEALPPTPTPAPAVGCFAAIQVSDGRPAILSGTQVALGNGVWLKIELNKKGDEVKLKVEGEKPELKIKLKKKGEIEVKVEGRGNLVITGAGHYPAGATLVVQVCAHADGTVVINVTTTAEAVTPAPTAAPTGGSVTICHIPPGNPSNRKTLTINQADAAGHLGHGDTLGPCGGGGSGDDDDDDDDDDD